ncbi:MAG: hypothetical protein N3J91_05245 [Verrucomicrobiae bacterium]|nr:hypothetical protein [Verrucomicrobiae bacterium]
MKPCILLKNPAFWWGLVCLGIIITALACGEQWRKTDRVTILQEKTSPGGRFVATAFECEGGGAAGYCYANVNVRRQGEAFNQRHFILGDKMWSGFGNFDLQWLGSNHLQVTYQGPKSPKWRQQNGSRKNECCGVKISYVER